MLVQVSGYNRFTYNSADVFPSLVIFVKFSCFSAVLENLMMARWSFSVSACMSVRMVCLTRSSRQKSACSAFLLGIFSPMDPDTSIATIHTDCLRLPSLGGYMDSFIRALSSARTIFSIFKSRL